MKSDDLIQLNKALSIFDTWESNPRILNIENEEYSVIDFEKTSDEIRLSCVNAKNKFYISLWKENTLITQFFDESGPRTQIEEKIDFNNDEEIFLTQFKKHILELNKDSE